MLYLISDFLIKAELFFYFCALIKCLKQVASVAELVDALDSKSSSFGSVGSIPTRGTNCLLIYVIGFLLLITNNILFIYILTPRFFDFRSLLTPKYPYKIQVFHRS